MKTNEDQINVPFTKDELTTVSSILNKILQTEHLQNLPRSGGSQQESEARNLPLIENAIFLKKNDCFHRINYADIIFVKAEGNYCEFHTRSKKYLHKITLGKMLSLLPKYYIQVHRGYLINLRHLESFCLYKNELVASGIAIPLGRNYRKHLAVLVFSD